VRARFVDARAAGRGVLQQHVIEFRTAHLEGVWPALCRMHRRTRAHRLVSAPAPRIPRHFPHADFLQFIPDPQALQDGHVERQQRLADVKARMTLLVHHGDIATFLGEQGADGGPGRAAADDKNLATALCSVLA